MTTQAAFLKDVEKHEIQIIRDDGNSRHVRLKRPGSYNMHFDLITWPGYLCFTGDMGTYVFSRLDDMFEFFRTDIDRGIDFRYWQEKLKAVDCGGGKGSATEFSKERFKAVINEYRVRWIKDSRDALSKEQRRELWEAVDYEVLDSLDDGEQVVYQRAYDFNWSAGKYLPGNYPSYRFKDLWDHRFTEYTFHFLWCCHAIAWGIQRYDEAKPPASASKDR